MNPCLDFISLVNIQGLLLLLANLCNRKANRYILIFKNDEEAKKWLIIEERIKILANSL